MATRRLRGGRPSCSCPEATRLLITADSAGPNGHRTRESRAGDRLAVETGLEMTVAHYPPGTSNWNRISPKMFSFKLHGLARNALVSDRTIIELISASTTQRARDPSRGPPP